MRVSQANVFFAQVLFDQLVGPAHFSLESRHCNGGRSFHLSVGPMWFVAQNIGTCVLSLFGPRFAAQHASYRGGWYAEPDGEFGDLPLLRGVLPADFSAQLLVEAAVGRGIDPSDGGVWPQPLGYSCGRFGRT